MSRQWLVWQLADSAFPSGAFAHSAGLEAAWQQGEVGAATLAGFVADAIAQAGHGALPFVTAAYDDRNRLPDVDERCDVFLRNVIVNRASRVQGRAWIGTIERTFRRASVQSLCDEVRRRVAARHHAPLFGAALAALDVDRHDAQRLFLFGVARGVLSAAVRIGIVGTHDGQRLLSEAGADLDATVAACGSLEVDDAAQVAPLLDLWQSAHDRLYSRLFQS